uniref:Uncharacterized protein n=1 Tax=Lepeophtheirus salmonis TaxID=72036 RepID=A0A0K2UM43_LEPSM
MIYKFLQIDPIAIFNLFLLRYSDIRIRTNCNTA